MKRRTGCAIGENIPEVAGEKRRERDNTIPRSWSPFYMFALGLPSVDGEGIIVEEASRGVTDT